VLWNVSEYQVYLEELYEKFASLVSKHQLAELQYLGFIESGSDKEFLLSGENIRRTEGLEKNILKKITLLNECFNPGKESLK
jgi:hypothetical protein